MQYALMLVVTVPILIWAMPRVKEPIDITLATVSGALVVGG
jgi:hypothetical protein